MTAQDVYGRLPVVAQNVVATGYGLRQLPIRHGGRYRRECADLDVRQWWTPERLAADQRSRLRSMITWCAARVPYYRDLFAELGIGPGDIADVTDLASLPLLDKETVRAAPDRFRPEPALRAIEQTTGGTTGTPLRYWATADAVRFNYATYETRSRRWAGVRLGDRMVAFHGQPIVPTTQVDPPFWRRNLAFNQLYCSVYHLNDANLPAYVAAIERYRPDLIVGYTSAVHRIAAYLVERGDLGRIRPRAVMVSSETLYPQDRADMEAAFGCRVTNSYSLGELVAYISECDHGELHVSPEYGVVELVETDVGREIVATGLANRAMPLLRYRTGDLAEPPSGDGSTLCGRGLPTVERLLGRADDVVHTPEGSTVGPAPMSLAFQTVPRLRRAQVRQDDPVSLDILIETAPGFGADDEAVLERELRRRLGPSIELHLERVDAVPRTSGGKERLIVSTLGRRSNRHAHGTRDEAER